MITGSAIHRFRVNHRKSLLFLLLLTFCLSACLPSPAPEPIAIHFVSRLWPELDGYVAQFEADHPGIQVEVTYRQEIADDWPRHFDGALIGGTSGQTELWLDLNPLIEADPGFDAADYYPAALQAGYVDGRLVALPVALSVRALLYDEHQWAAAGAAAPTPEWTWGDLLNRAETIGRYQAQQGEGHVFVSEGDRNGLLLNWLAEQAPLTRQDDGRIIPMLDTPEVAAAVAEVCGVFPFLTVAVNAGYLDRQPADYLAMGKAAMTDEDLVWASRQLAQQPALAFAPYPQPSIYRPVQAWRSLAISRGTANPQAVWQWIVFLSRQSALARSELALPARKSVAADLDVWQRWNPETTRVVLTMLNGTHEAQNEEALWIVHSNALFALLTACEQEVSPLAALRTVQQETMEDLATWETGQDKEPEAFQVVPAPVSDEAVQALDFFTPYWSEQAITAVSDAFEASHPEASIRIVPGWDRADCSLSQVRRDDGMTLLWTEQGVFQIEDVGEVDSSLGNQDFFPSALEAASWKGQLIGVPVAVRPLALYYDANTMEELGIPLPTSEWTVADVLDAAEAVVEADRSRIGYAPDSGDAVRFVLEQQGIPLFTDESPVQPRFTAPDVLQALQRLQALQGGGAIISSRPAVLSLPMTTGEPHTPSGVMMRVTALQPRPGTRWPVYALVGVVPRHSTNVRLAWEWLTFLTSQEGAYGRALPAVRAVAGSDRVRLLLGEERYSAYQTALERDTAPPPTFEAQVIESAALWWFSEALSQVQGGDLETALQLAQVAAERFVACAAGVEATDLNAVSICAREVDPKHPLAHLSP